MGEKRMYNNSYYGGGQYPNSYYPTYTQNYGAYQNQQQQMQQRQMQFQDIPFTEVRYGTLDEAKAYIVMPTKSAMFIDRDNGVAYIKSADMSGKPALEGYKYSKIDENPSQPVSPVLDTKDFVRASDLGDIVRKDDLKGLLSADDVTNFVTKDDIKALNEKIEQLKKHIKINDILKNGVNDDEK